MDAYIYFKNAEFLFSVNSIDYTVYFDEMNMTILKGKEPVFSDLNISRNSAFKELKKYY